MDSQLRDLGFGIFGFHSFGLAIAGPWVWRLWFGFVWKRREKKGGGGTKEVSIGSVRLSMKVSTSASIIFAGVEGSGLVRV